MVVHVLYVTTVREITSKSGEDVEVKDHATLRDVLDRLTETYGVKFRDAMMLQQGVPAVFVASPTGRKNLQSAHTMDTVLTREATITIGPIVTGG